MLANDESRDAKTDKLGSELICFSPSIESERESETASIERARGPKIKESSEVSNNRLPQPWQFRNINVL